MRTELTNFLGYMVHDMREERCHYCKLSVELEMSVDIFLDVVDSFGL